MQKILIFFIIVASLMLIVVEKVNGQDATSGDTSGEPKVIIQSNSVSNVRQAAPTATWSISTNPRVRYRATNGGTEFQVARATPAPQRGQQRCWRRCN